MRLRLAAVLLAASLVLAGCNLPATGGSATPSPTPAPTPTASPTETPGRPPDIGVSATGVDDPMQLAYAHSLVLVEQSFSMLDRTTVRNESGAVVYRRTVRARVSGDHLRYHATRTSAAADGAPDWVLRPYPDEPRHAETYANATVAVQRVRAPRERRVRRRLDSDSYGPPVSSNRFLRQMTIILLFQELDTRVSEIRRDGDTTLYVLTAADDDYTHGTTFFPGNRTGTVRSFRAVVTAEGLVRNVELTYAVSRNGTTFTVTRRLAFDDLGVTTVERPPWVEEVLANATAATSTPLAGTVTPDGSEGTPETRTRTSTATGTPTPAGTGTPTPTDPNGTAARSATAVE